MKKFYPRRRLISLFLKYKHRSIFLSIWPEVISKTDSASTSHESNKGKSTCG